MKEFQAFTTQHLGLKDYICIPVYQFGKLKFIEGRLAKDISGKPKYYRRPQAASVADCLFPLDKDLAEKFTLSEKLKFFKTSLTFSLICSF